MTYDNPPRKQSFEEWKREHWRSTAAEEKTRQRAPFPVAMLSNSIRSVGRTNEEVKPRFFKSEVSLSLCSANAMKVALLLPFHIRAFGDKADKRFRTITLSVPQLSAALGLNYRLTKARVEKLLEEVVCSAFSIRTEGTYVVMPVVSLAELDFETGLVRLKLNPELEPYLLELEGEFFKISPRIMGLRLPRAINLYLMLKRWSWTKSCRASIKELRDTLHVSKGMPWWIFQRDVLEPSLKEIGKTTDIRVLDYKPERKGHTDRERGGVDAVSFKIGRRLILKRKPESSARNSA
jgi:Initiator Replication protein